MRPLLITLTALAVSTPISPAQPYDLDVPWGMHGPTYSHQYGDPNVWANAQSVFDAFHQLGMDYARMDIWWSRVEPVRGQWEWDHFDRAIQSYHDNGVRLMAILGYGPEWNRGEGPSDEETRQAWAQYVERIVGRYSDTVFEWEIWNEPNILPFWTPLPNVEHYAELLRVSYDTIKRVSPDAVVLGGAMAGADTEFLRGIFEHGGGQYFDVLTYHSYNQHPTREMIEQEVTSLREILAENGRPDVPIWLSEHGLFTGPGGTNEEMQARDVVRMAVWRNAAGVERSVYLSMRDWHASEDAAEARDFWGLLDHAGTPKRSWSAVQTMLAAMRHRPYLGEVHLGEGIEAFVYGDVNDNRMVIWADDERDLAIDLGTAHLTVQSLTGDCEMRTSPDGRHTLSLSPDPQWLHGVGANMILLAGTQTSPLTLARGEAGDLWIRVRNPLSIHIQMDIAEGAAPGIETEEPPAISLGPHQAIEIPMGVSVADDAPVGPIPVTLALNPSGMGPRDGAAVHHAVITVADPFTVAEDPLDRLDEDGNLPLRFLVENHTVDPIEMESRLALGGEPAAQRTDTIERFADIEFALPLDRVVGGSASEITAQFTAADHTASLEESIRVYAIPHLAHEVSIDGDISEWAGEPTLPPDQFTEVDFNPHLTGGADDISARGWLAWSDEGLWVALEIRDDVIDLPTDRIVWDHDGLQFALDTRHNSPEGEPYGYDDIEIEIGRLRDGTVLVYAGQYPPGRIDEIVPEQSQVAAAVTEGSITYEALFPAGVLDPMRFEPGALVGLNLIHNDADANGREGWIELAPGIGWGKEPSHFPTGVLMPE